MSNKNIFDEDEQVDRIVFRPLNLDMAQSVKKVSDPAPRPLPQPLDKKETSSDWIPGAKKERKKKKTGETKDLSWVGDFSKWAIFTVFSLGIMGGVGWLVYWIAQQYQF